MSIYSDIPAIVTSALTDYGQAVTLRKITTAGTFDAVTGTKLGEATTDYTVHVVNLEMDDVIRQQFDVQGQDRLYLIDASQTVARGDKLVIAGESWPIIEIKETAPDGTPLCYMVQVRK